MEEEQDIVDGYSDAHKIHNNFRSYVWIDTKKNIHKTYKNLWLQKLIGHDLRREVKIMKKMQKHGVTPELINFDKQTGEITMSDCGETLRGYNGDIPLNFEAQLDQIYEKFKSEHVYNKDFLSKNTCVKQGKIYIIDFGFAEILKEGCKDYDKKMEHMRSTIEELKLTMRSGFYEQDCQSEFDGWLLAIAILAVVIAVIILLILFFV